MSTQSVPEIGFRDFKVKKVKGGEVAGLFPDSIATDSLTHNRREERHGRTLRKRSNRYLNLINEDSRIPEIKTNCLRRKIENTDTDVTIVANTSCDEVSLDSDHNVPNSSANEKGKSKKSKNYEEYHENPKQRLETFKRSGKNIAQHCKRLEFTTRCKVYFKAEFTSISNKIIKHQYGEDFSESGSSGLKSKVQTGTLVNDSSPSSSTLLKVCPPIPNHLTPPVTLKDVLIAPSYILVPSSKITPVKKMPDPPSSTDSTPCLLCKKDKVKGPDLKVIESIWVLCKGGDEPCPTRVHADCLGFPGAKQLPDYYCPSHIIYGRRNERVNSYYE